MWAYKHVRAKTRATSDRDFQHARSAFLTVTKGGCPGGLPATACIKTTSPGAPDCMACACMACAARIASCWIGVSPSPACAVGGSGAAARGAGSAGVAAGCSSHPLLRFRFRSSRFSGAPVASETGAASSLSDAGMREAFSPWREMGARPAGLTEESRRGDRISKSTTQNMNLRILISGSAPGGTLCTRGLPQYKF